eukprot:gene7786-8597_t
MTSNQADDELSGFIMDLLTEDIYSDCESSALSPSSSSSSTSLQKRKCCNPSTESGELSDEVDLSKKPKTRRAWRRAHPIPRLLKSDIRRSLATMFSNALNSGEPEMISGFFSRYGVSSCRMNFLSLTRQEVLSWLGLQSILPPMLEQVNLMPDFVLEIKNVGIRQTLDEAGSQIIVLSRMRGTRLYETNHQYVDQQDQVHVLSSSCMEAFFLGKEGACQPRLLQPQLYPKPLDMLVTKTYWLDNNHRIYRIDVVREESESSAEGEEKRDESCLSDRVTELPST